MDDSPTANPLEESSKSNQISYSQSVEDDDDQLAALSLQKTTPENSSFLNDSDDQQLAALVLPKTTPENSSFLNDSDNQQLAAMILPKPTPKNSDFSGSPDLTKSSQNELQKFYDSDDKQLADVIMPKNTPKNNVFFDENDDDDLASFDLPKTTPKNVIDLDDDDDVIFVMPIVGSGRNRARRPSGRSIRRSRRLNDVIEVPTDRSTRSRTRITRKNTQKNKESQENYGKPLKKRKISRKNDKNSVDIIDLDESLPEKAPEPEVDDEFNYEINVKVLWQSVKVIKVPLRMQQKMSKVYEEIVKIEAVEKKNIYLTFKGVQIADTDTPHTLGLKIFDFLDGGVVINAANSSEKSKKSESHKRHDLQVKFQNSSKKSVLIPGFFSDKMRCLMSAYCEQVDKPVGSFKYYFDGSLVKPDDTVESLGLENDEVIDVKEA